MIKENIQKILSEISAYDNVTLVVVTKNRSTDEIKQVLDSGITNIAENRVQEAETKFSILHSLFSILNIKKHLIGHLQSNKIKKAVELFDVIQSVDSWSLLEQINKEAIKQNKIIEIMLQINIFEDDKKFGFKLNEISTEKIIEAANLYKNTKIIGLMTIAKQGISEKETLEGFKKLKNLKENISKNSTFSIHNSLFSILSIGMSHDYKIALEAGSSMIRVGSAIFENHR